MLDMGVLIQVREVPEDVRRRLKVKAAAAGLSLNQYLQDVLARESGRPSIEEFMERVRARGVVQLDEPSEVTVRRLRDALE